MPDAFRVTILGGGFTGTAAAIELLRRIPVPFELTVVEPDELGRGIAFGKSAPSHLLNVRAAELGIFHDRRKDFAAWASNTRYREIHVLAGRPDPAKVFLPRRMLGDCVQERLSEAVAGRPDVIFVHRRALAVRVDRSPDGFDVGFEEGPSVAAMCVVLATGYGRLAPTSRFGRTPFTPIDPDEVRAARSVLLVGTGLTSVDTLLDLRDKGFVGKAVAVSRRGLLPEAHPVEEQPVSARPIIPFEPDLIPIVEMFHRAATKGEPTPAAALAALVKSLRGGFQERWQALGTLGQRRFLRHVRPYWNVVRHRLPPDANVQLRRELRSGDLTVIAGRAMGTPEEGDLRIQTATDEVAGSGFDLVFDCSGHRPDSSSLLARSLIDGGLVRVDPHRLGLAVAPDGAVVDPSGARRYDLFALGPLGHGSLYEITAVQEIVSQAAAMAGRLEASMSGAPSSGGVGSGR
jgi:uncharacterized NAD(P)/FAD-binding protein YdhS